MSSIEGSDALLKRHRLWIFGHDDGSATSAAILEGGRNNVKSCLEVISGLGGEEKLHGRRGHGLKDKKRAGTTGFTLFWICGEGRVSARLSKSLSLGGPSGLSGRGK